MNIEDIYQYVYNLANKTQSGEWSDTLFNNAAAFVNMDIFRKQTGLPEDYMPNNPTPRVAWQITTTISDDLRLLLKTATINKSNGYFAFPTDYAAYSSMGYLYTYNNPTGNPTSQKVYMEAVTDDEKKIRLRSVIKEPTLDYPICTYSLNGFEVYPQLIDKIELTYLKIPATPFRNFTQLANDETVYDPVGSVQFEYPETLYPNIASRIALVLGINIRSEEFVAYMQQRKQEGN